MPKPRPHILRLFQCWLKTSRSRFQIPAPQLVHCNDQSLRFTFPSLPGNFAGVFNRMSGITLAVNFRGECWDLIGDFHTVEEHNGRGFFCRLCLPEYRMYYPSREALWTQHCFESFLQWCNETLAPAKWLALYDYDGMTEARLLRNKNDDQWNNGLLTLKRELVKIDGRPAFHDPRRYTYILIPLQRNRQLAE